VFPLAFAEFRTLDLSPKLISILRLKMRFLYQNELSRFVQAGNKHQKLCDEHSRLKCRSEVILDTILCGQVPIDIQKSLSRHKARIDSHTKELSDSSEKCLDIGRSLSRSKARLRVMERYAAKSRFR
jgi:hypothetical protein